MIKSNSLGKLFCLFLFISASCSVFAQEFTSTPYPDRITLTWSGDPSTTQSVTWRTDVSILQGKAQIKREDSSPDMERSVKEYPTVLQVLKGNNGLQDHYHTIQFSDLSPSTVYIYRVGDSTHWSEWSQFRTADALDSNNSFSFIYMGDGQNDLKSKWSRAIRQAFRAQPDARFIIHTGDLINRPNTDIEWGEWHYGAGFIHQSIPAVPTPGNHEYFRDEQRNLLLDPHWNAQFALPKNGPADTEAVYFLDYQNIRIIALNSQLIMLDSVAREAQMHWLEDVLKNSNQRWNIVMMHHPIHSTAKNRDNKVLREQFKPIFERYGVDLVLQGHDHTYARGRGPGAAADGPMYVLSVAGPKMYESDSERWMDVALTNTQLYQTIQIANEKLEYKAYKISGELFDSFTIKK